MVRILLDNQREKSLKMSKQKPEWLFIVLCVQACMCVCARAHYPPPKMGTIIVPFSRREAEVQRREMIVQRWPC